MDTLYQYAPLIIAFAVGLVAGGYAMYVVKISLPKNMDKIINIAIHAISQVQYIYGDNTIDNAKKAVESLNIANLALQDAGIKIDLNTLAMIIRVAYHSLKPEVKLLNKESPPEIPDHK